MFDGLKAYDQIDFAIREGNPVARANQELQIVQLIPPGGMNDRVFRQIDPNDVRGRSSQDFAAISFAACDVEYALAATKLRRPVVPMEMFQLYLAPDLRHVSFTRPGRSLSGVSVPISKFVYSKETFPLQKKTMLVKD